MASQGEIGVQLLVSVRDAQEATVALSGGAAIIDAKDPSGGALGAVSGVALAGIAAAVPEQTPLSAALGDTLGPREAFRAARQAADAGVGYVKLGFLGIQDANEIRQRVRAAVRGAAGDARVIAVAYADWSAVSAASPDVVLSAATRAGAGGVLLDTAEKTGSALFDVMCVETVAAWLAAAHRCGLMTALAGSLDADGVMQAADLGADVVGVRGAACDGGREGRLSAERILGLALVAGGGLLPRSLEGGEAWCA